MTFPRPARPSMTESFPEEVQAELRSWPPGAVHSPPFENGKLCCWKCREEWLRSSPAELLVFPSTVKLTLEDHRVCMAAARARQEAARVRGDRRQDGSPQNVLQEQAGALAELALAKHLGLADWLHPLNQAKGEPDVATYHVRAGMEPGYRLWARPSDPEGIYVLLTPTEKGRYGAWSIRGWASLSTILERGEARTYNGQEVRYLPYSALTITALPKDD